MAGMTYRLGLIGYPLEHSVSPAIHAAALAALGLAGEYRLYPVETRGGSLLEIQKLLSQVRQGALHGLNVTIPYKQAVLPLVDEATPVARATGAVNTLSLRTGRLVGDNTDVSGFLEDLTTAGGNPHGGTPADNASKAALVLGAGGSARAVTYALLQAGWDVTIAARRPEQAGELARSLETSAFSGKVRGMPLNASTLRSISTSLIVNATPAGMHPDIKGSPWPEGVPFSNGAFVYDLVYNPLETTLLKRARTAGLRAANGLGMLVEQAALAFESWTGETAPREEMREAAKQAFER